MSFLLLRKYFVVLQYCCSNINFPCCNPNTIDEATLLIKWSRIVISVSKRGVIVFFYDAIIITKYSTALITFYSTSEYTHYFLYQYNVYIIFVMQLHILKEEDLSFNQ